MIGVPDDKWGELVTALVVRRRGRAVTEDDIIAHAAKLAGYKCPKRVEFRDDARPHGHRQAAEVQAARAVLGGLRPPGELTARAWSTLCAPTAPCACAVALRRKSRAQRRIE